MFALFLSSLIIILFVCSLLESNKAPKRDADCNRSNAEDSFVAVPTLVEFEDATTSQTESNNILSLKGRDARKKVLYSIEILYILCYVSIVRLNEFCSPS